MVLLPGAFPAPPARPKGRLEATLRKWDAGTRASRMRQLDEFVLRCGDMTGPQLEEELESGASLLLARISSWLRLSYALGHSVALQLRAIAVFVAASSGQRFLAEFVEVGGVATVIEILSLPQLPQDDKRCAMRLLSSIAAAGRHYKEIVCEGDGVEALETFMAASKSEELLEDAVSDTRHCATLACGDGRDGRSLPPHLSPPGALVRVRVRSAT